VHPGRSSGKASIHVIGRSSIQTKEYALNNLKVFLAIAVLLTSATAAAANDLVYRHSVQANVIGLVFNRYGFGYEYRFTPHNALFLEAGGAIPVVSDEVEYGAGLHYRYCLAPARDAKFLWLFRTADAISFGGFNVRYMKLVDGVYNGSHYSYEAAFVGIHVGQTYLWHSGFTISWRFGYGIPFGEFQWQDSKPEDGDSWARFYKLGSGLDFGLSLGYSF
jgi:hypothetical protein